MCPFRMSEIVFRVANLEHRQGVAITTRTTTRTIAKTASVVQMHKKIT